MAYDEDLADRIRELTAEEPARSEQRMFGGLAFLVGGHMAVAASGQGGLLVRIDPADADALLDQPGVGPMEMRGRPLRGWLLVDADQLGSDHQLAAWVGRGTSYVRTLPPKQR